MLFYNIVLSARNLQNSPSAILQYCSQYQKSTKLLKCYFIQLFLVPEIKQIAPVLFYTIVLSPRNLLNSLNAISYNSSLPQISTVLHKGVLESYIWYVNQVSARRRPNDLHKTATNDDKKIQGVLQRLHFHIIPTMEVLDFTPLFLYLCFVLLYLVLLYRTIHVLNISRLLK